jgi:hypothetical protein
MRSVKLNNLLNSDMSAQEVTPLRAVARDQDTTATTLLKLN